MITGSVSQQYLYASHSGKYLLITSQFHPISANVSYYKPIPTNTNQILGNTSIYQPLPYKSIPEQIQAHLTPFKHTSIFRRELGSLVATKFQTEEKKTFHEHVVEESEPTAPQCCQSQQSLRSQERSGTKHLYTGRHLGQTFIQREVLEIP